ncbi:MAG: peptidoglycan DD-metalloendopeptidase family protein [Alphaproteobacteria bacterium]|nr:peptidoglycan DD-metalloendopeptidase family protein [Alphaproteobacteria bacterium]
MLKKLILVLLVCVIGTPMWAAPTAKDLAKIEAQIKQEKKVQAENKRKSQALDKEVQNVQKEMVSLAKSVRKHEGELSLLEQKKKELEKQQAELEERLSLSSKQLSKIMQGMQTLALRPSEILLFQSKTPIQVLRSKRLMQYSFPIVGGIQAQTQSDLATLSQVKFDLQTKISAIKTTKAELSDKNEKMEKLAQQKKVLQAQYTSTYEKSKAKTEKLAKEASSLKELLAKIEKERKKQPKTQVRHRSFGTGAFARARGSLALPAQGRITQNFGDTTGASQSHAKGMVVTTRGGAQVTAPFDGTVLFAGPFQNYGKLVIIDHGDNYLTVLAGMDTITTSVGSQILTGEPVGRMSSDYRSLYIEVRQNGQAINPRPWFI